MSDAPAADSFGYTELEVYVRKRNRWKYSLQTAFSTQEIQHYYLLTVAGKYLLWYGQTWLVTSDMLSRIRDLQKPVGKEMQKFAPFQEFVQELWSEVRLKVRQLQIWCAKQAPWWKKRHQWSQEHIRRYKANEIEGASSGFSGPIHHIQWG